MCLSTQLQNTITNTKTKTQQLFGHKTITVAVSKHNTHFILILTNFF